VFLRSGTTCDLGGATVTATSPIILSGEGNQALIKNGIIKIVGNGTWTDNITGVNHLRFENAGGTVSLWLQSVIHSLIGENVFYKSSYVAGSPSLRLTTCLTARVLNNWFDGYQMQIIKIDGSASVIPLHIIRDNDFGSTATAFPAYSDPAEVAAIHIFDGSNLGCNIEGNLAYLNTKNVFVVSEAPQTHVINNRITCGSGNYAIDLRHDENDVADNLISVPSASSGAIAIRNPTNLGEAKYRNHIVNNKIYGMECTNAVYGVMHNSFICENHIEAKNHIVLHNSGYNQVAHNRITKYGAGPWTALNETGSTGLNNIADNIVTSGIGITLNATGGSVIHHNAGYAIEHHTSDDTLTLLESGTVHTNLGAGGAVTITLPQTILSGTTFEFAVMTAQQLRIDPGAAGAIYINGAKQTDDAYIWADDEGESVKLVADGVGDWVALGAVGTWTAV